MRWESRVAHRAALRYTVSSLAMFMVVCGSHIVEAFSNCGRTNVLQAVDLRFLLCTFIFFLRNPYIRFAYLKIESMWGLQERSSEIVTIFCR